jgi:cytochrome b561
MLSLCLFILLSTQVLSQDAFKVSQADGSVGFSGKHVGMTFKGEFLRWNAQLLLPPASQAFVNAEFDLGSAETGDSTYDDTLPEGDWFDVDNHPRGLFKSTKVIEKNAGYEVQGDLTLRGKSLPVTFTLIKEAGRLKSEFIVDRLAYGIGIESDPEAEWVNKEIILSLNIPMP